MIKTRRTAIDKINTFFKGKDLRITEGEPYTEIREFDYSSYYPKDNYIREQQIPKGDNVFDIRDYGAIADKTDYDCSKAINKALLDASKVNGTVLIYGGNYMSTTVFLQSNVTLFIDKDASLIANPSGMGFENDSFIYGKEIENITITGGGCLKCDGDKYGLTPYFNSNITEPDKYIDVIKMRADYRAQLRFAHPSKYGGPLNLFKCHNVKIDNFVIENSPYWTFRLQECKEVDVKNFVINNNRNVANADGFDIVGGKNIKISHCFISTADDGICMKNAIWLGCHSAMENIEISNCEVISRTNSIKIGTETTHDIKNINIHHCKLFMTDLYPGSVSGISLEACDGTKLHNINIDNIEMTRCTCPIFIRLGNRNRASSITEDMARAVEFSRTDKSDNTIDEVQKARAASMKIAFNHKSEVYDISISNVFANQVELPIIIAGYKQGKVIKRVKNVTLDNININYVDKPEIIDRRIFIPEYADVYPESWRFRNLPSYGLWARHTENLSVNLKINHPKSTWKKEIILDDCKNFISK